MYRMVESLYYTPDTNITLDVNYTGIKIKSLIKKEKKLERRDVQREDDIKSQGEDSHLYTKERGLEKKPTLPTLWSQACNRQHCEKEKICR